MMKLYEKQRNGNLRIIKVFGRKLLSYRKIAITNDEIATEIDDLKRMIGCQVLEYRKVHIPAGIKDAELKVYSQWGEDGIIQWIISRLPEPIPIFIEFGVENYMESNTRFLLTHNNWSGLVMDGSEQNIDSIKACEFYWRHELTAINAFVDKDNINSLISENKFSGEIGILSIDLDGVDYWVLREISVVNPQIVICEFNGIFGANLAVTVPYRPDFQRLKAHVSGQYFGASLKAFEVMLAEKGYALIGINSNAVNAFFVRNDLAQYFDVKNSGSCFVFPKHRDVRNDHGDLVYLGRLEEKLQLIRHKKLYDIVNQKTYNIADLFGV